MVEKRFKHEVMGKAVDIEVERQRLRSPTKSEKKIPLSADTAVREIAEAV